MKTLLSSFFGLFMILSMSAQVGVNNPTPEQALDVNGKVKLTNDATTPTAGTMRYDATSSDFEGYNGSQWNSFTQSRSSGLPPNAVPVFGYSINPSSNFSLQSVSFKRWADGLVFSQVPDGKYLIVTSISHSTYGPIQDEDVNRVTIGPATSISSGSSYSSGALSLNRKGYNNTIDRNSGQSPLFILSPGEYLNFSNSTTNNILINVRGFLVHNLNY